MTRMYRQSLAQYGAPLCETVAEIPKPAGTEILLKTTRCGVCHSDLHMQDGYFLLGDGKTLDVRAGRSLPFTLGHEIVGLVESVGPDANVRTGSEFAVYPWIGCGRCSACKAGDENICAAPRHLGITVDGGYASHVLVPHPRYLIDFAPLPSRFAAILMCSGLTAYAALKRLSDRAHRGPILLVGLGGVGLMGLALARAMFKMPVLVADIDENKRTAAIAAGAAEAFDPADAGARKALLKATGGVYAACDFAGSEASLTFATGVLAKGGKAVVTGLIGGAYTVPVAMFSLKAMTIEGTTTGTLAEAHELIELVRAEAIEPLPIAERPFAAASATLDDLRAGRIVGRIVLAA